MTMREQNTQQKIQQQETQTDEKTYTKKREDLQRKLLEYTKEDCIVAFSGGVDSGLLLKMVCDAAAENGSQVYAVTLQTKLHPIGETTYSRMLAEEIGTKHILLPVDELLEAGIEYNPTDRCYLCKKHLFGKLVKKAEELGAAYILEGTNADDLLTYRPGLRAIHELGILSPLAEAGFTKEEVRKMVSEYGLSVSKRPSSPCLATRFPYGARLSYERMRQVELGEMYLRSMGFYNVRIRVYGETARLEVDADVLTEAVKKRKEITDYLKQLGFLYVTLDLEGFRSGSMDEHLKQKV